MPAAVFFEQNFLDINVTYSACCKHTTNALAAVSSVLPVYQELLYPCYSLAVAAWLHRRSGHPLPVASGCLLRVVASCYTCVRSVGRTELDPLRLMVLQFLERPCSGRLCRGLGTGGLVDTQGCTADAQVSRNWLIVDGQWSGSGWGVDGLPEAAASSHALHTFCRHPEE